MYRLDISIIWYKTSSADRIRQMQLILRCLFCSVVFTPSRSYFQAMKLLVVLAIAVGMATAHRSSTCERYFKEAGLSSNFNETIAHGIHSMTVQALQRFNPRVTVDNRVPTVNLNRSAAEKVIPYAPDYPTSHDFSTQTMNMIDRILSEIGNSKDGLGPDWSPLERVVHNFHMMDVWNRVHQIYEEETLQNPPSDELCGCLMQTQENGIYQAMTWVSDHYNSGTTITLLNLPIPKLTDADSWGIWKYRLLYYYTEHALSDTAKFVYCATKDF